ncbi:uncharacterized protein LOC144618343 [Crassostrea virginica]
MLETMDLYADLLFIILFNLCKVQGSETGVCFRSDVGIVLCCRNFKLENNTCVPCPAGWWDTNCSQRCPSGKFGSLCSKTCRCDNCSHVYGCTDDLKTVPTKDIELTDIENPIENGSISGLFNLTVETWIILSSAGGLVIIISVVGVSCVLW